MGNYTQNCLQACGCPNTSHTSHHTHITSHTHHTHTQTHTHTHTHKQNTHKCAPASELTDLDMSTISKLLTALNECTEWGQVFILDSLASYQPTDEREAQNICERVTPRLSHANAAVVLSAVKVYNTLPVSHIQLCCVVFHKIVRVTTLHLLGHLVTCLCHSSFLQVLMKFMEMMPPDSDFLQQLAKKLAPPLGNCPGTRLHSFGAVISLATSHSLPGWSHACAPAGQGGASG